MVNILIENIKNELIKMCEENYKRTGYNYWDNHIKYVVKIANDLAEKYDADGEIVEISAILHDIAKVLEERENESHNIVGAEIAYKFLQKYSLSENQIKQIQNCILKHSGEVDIDKLTIEEWCVRNADAISVFHNITILYYLAFNEYKMDYSKGQEFVKDMIRVKFNSIDEKLQIEYKNQYDSIVEVI